MRIAKIGGEWLRNGSHDRVASRGAGACLEAGTTHPRETAGAIS